MCNTDTLCFTIHCVTGTWCVTRIRMATICDLYTLSHMDTMCATGTLCDMWVFIYLKKKMYVTDNVVIM